MKYGKSLKILLVLLMITAMVACSVGCGGETTNLAFDNSASNPVITFHSYQAIAPIYNPDSPVALIYGDGTVIREEDTYRYTTGKLTGDEGVEGLLKALSDMGFFSMKEEYKGEPLAGGVTEVLTVKLEDGTHTVSVQGGEGPQGWEGIVGLVTEVQTTGSEEYIPSSITLFAEEAPDVPTDASVIDWPGNSEDLDQAASSAESGLVLEGEEAAVAWKAISGSLDVLGEAFWKAGDRYYTYVYATPIFPGVADTEDAEES